MTPYDLIVTSASRPHLLRPTLASFLEHADQVPARVLVHDDAVFPGQGEAVSEAIRATCWDRVEHVLSPAPAPLVLHRDDPPIRLGMSLAWLLRETTVEYVVYSQDDFVTVRGLPIRRALYLMARYGLHSIRFNKRATMQVKDTWRGPWAKEELRFAAADDPETDADLQVLCVADHWGFQTSVWRAATIRAAVAFCAETTPERRALFASGRGTDEAMVNRAMDGEEGPVPGLLVPLGGDPFDVAVRKAYQKTFIYGPVGEDRYIRHIGVGAADWAGDHPRGAGEGTDAQVQRAWAEIEEHRRREAGR